MFFLNKSVAMNKKNVFLAFRELKGLLNAVEMHDETKVHALSEASYKILKIQFENNLKELRQIYKKQEKVLFDEFPPGEWDPHNPAMIYGFLNVQRRDTHFKIMSLEAAIENLPNLISNNANRIMQTWYQEYLKAFVCFCPKKFVHDRAFQK